MNNREWSHVFICLKSVKCLTGVSSLESGQVKNSLDFINGLSNVSHNFLSPTYLGLGHNSNLPMNEN